MKAAAVDAMMALIRDDLAALGIRHDVFFSERMLHQSGAIPAAIADLEKKGLIYIGTLEPPRARSPMTGKNAHKRCSAPRSLATTSTGH